METVIRSAERRDLGAIGRLGAKLVREHHGYDPERFIEAPPDVERGYASYLGTQLGNPEAVVLVAEQGSEIVGYVYAGLEPMSWMELRGPAGFLHDVVVAEKARRTGVGTRLCEAAAAWLEEHGAPRVMLWTAERNTGAQRLFNQLGFRRTVVEMTRERADRRERREQVDGTAGD